MLKKLGNLFWFIPVIISCVNLDANNQKPNASPSVNKTELPVSYVSVTPSPNIPYSSAPIIKISPSGTGSGISSPNPVLSTNSGASYIPIILDTYYLSNYTESGQKYKRKVLVFNENNNSLISIIPDTIKKQFFDLEVFNPLQAINPQDYYDGDICVNNVLFISAASLNKDEPETKKLGPLLFRSASYEVTVKSKQALDKLLSKYEKYGIRLGASISGLSYNFSLRIDKIDLSGIYQNIKQFNSLGIKGSPIKDITFSSFKAAKIMSAFFEIANERYLVDSIGFPLGNPLFNVSRSEIEWATDCENRALGINQSPSPASTISSSP